VAAAVRPHESSLAWLHSLALHLALNSNAVAVILTGCGWMDDYRSSIRKGLSHDECGSALPNVSSALAQGERHETTSCSRSKQKKVKLGEDEFFWKEGSCVKIRR